MNLSLVFLYNKIEQLRYNSVSLEFPIPDIISFDYKTIIDPPPSNTDPKTLKELNFVAESTFNRSEAEIEQIYSIDRDLDAPFIKLLSKYKLEYPQEFINTFYNVVKPVVKNIKHYRNRPRPVQLAKLFNIKIDPIVTRTVHTPSYPSGHTMYSRLVANILKHHYPQLENKILDNIVYDTARARVMMGVHFPSDNQASIFLSNYLFKNLVSKMEDR
jgi:hypothetical protein